LVFHAHYPYYPTTHLAGRSVVRSAAHVIAVSDFVREAYLRFDVSADRISTVHNGIDVDAYASRERRSGQVSNASDTYTVLLPGRLSRYKGQLELIEAMPAILQDFPETRFVLAGYDSPETGDLANEGPTVLPILQRRASDLGVGG